MRRVVLASLTAINLIALMAIGRAVTPPAPGTSKWVRVGDDQRLHYTTDARGIRIMDFSHAGYMGGGVHLPTARVARTVRPTSGDATSAIQTAIDEVSKRAPDVWRTPPALRAR